MWREGSPVVRSCGSLESQSGLGSPRIGSQMAADLLRNRRAKAEPESLSDSPADEMSPEVEGIAGR